MKKKVYIAGPYTKGDVAQNVAVAMNMWHELEDRGYSAFCPHLSHFLHIHRQRPYTDWIEYDLLWLPHCDYLLRMPGDSSGADGEVAKAKELGIPVFYAITELPPA